MSKGLTAIFGATGIFALALLVSVQAEAGSSASAPSKYRPNDVRVAQQERQVQKPSQGITDFSASARRPSQRQSHE
jgi:hypothetical protein